MNLDPERLRTLALLLASPDAESRTVLGDLARNQPWLQPGVEPLATVALERWQEEHTRLFINGFPKVVASPFASAWTRQGASGEVQQKIGLLYAEAGVTAQDLPPDYLGSLLECAALLTERNQLGDAALLERLLHSHLLPWLQAFTTALEQGTDMALYRLLARTLARDLVQEQAA
ncbi:MAG: molecular chaperone TorD family protein [Magnetococcales bacterium]|nr:molecular chaperone TorD family protein [Magnetococcales bacterium]